LSASKVDYWINLKYMCANPNENSQNRLMVFVAS
jgi:hypothetical protein